MKKICLALAMIMGMAMMPVVVFAEGESKCAEGQIETSTFGCQDKESAINNLLNLVLNIMTVGVGVIGTLGILVAGIQYLTARDSDEQVSKAKKRLVQIVIGMVLYAMMWGLLRFLLPGVDGLF